MFDKRRSSSCAVVAGTCKVRRAPVDDADEVALTHFWEVFTSRNWLVRRWKTAPWSPLAATDCFESCRVRAEGSSSYEAER